MIDILDPILNEAKETKEKNSIVLPRVLFDIVRQESYSIIDSCF